MNNQNKVKNLSFTILGCGSSGGVPRLSDGWGLCDPNNVKNFRLRCSLLITHETNSGKSWYLIDTSPDLRQQLFDGAVLGFGVAGLRLGRAGSWWAFATRDEFWHTPLARGASV